MASTSRRPSSSSHTQPLLLDADRASSSTSTSTCAAVARLLTAALSLLSRLLTPASDLATLDALPFVQDALPPGISPDDPRERRAVARRVAQAAVRAEARGHLEGARRAEAAWRRCRAQLQLLDALGDAGRLLKAAQAREEEEQQQQQREEEPPTPPPPAPSPPPPPPPPDTLAELEWMATATPRQLDAVLEAARAALAEVGRGVATSAEAEGQRRGQRQRRQTGGSTNNSAHSPSYSDEEEEDRALSLLLVATPSRLPSDLRQASSSWVQRHGGGVGGGGGGSSPAAVPRSVAGMMHSRAARAKAAALAEELASIDRPGLAWALDAAVDGARLRSLASAWSLAWRRRQGRPMAAAAQEGADGDEEAPALPSSSSSLLECVAKAALVVRPADAAPVALCVAPEGGGGHGGAADEAARDARVLRALRAASAAQVAALMQAESGRAEANTSAPLSPSSPPPCLLLSALAEKEEVEAADEERGGSEPAPPEEATRTRTTTARGKHARSAPLLPPLSGADDDLEAGRD
jgi:hypothetical protein